MSMKQKGKGITQGMWKKAATDRSLSPTEAEVPGGVTTSEARQSGKGEKRRKLEMTMQRRVKSTGRVMVRKQAVNHRTSRSSEASRQRESLLERGSASSRDVRQRGSEERQVAEVEKARRENHTGGEDYDLTHAEENHQREESPLEERRNEHEHEQDDRMGYMEEESHHQAEQGEQAQEQDQDEEEEEEEEEDLFLLEAMRSSPAVKAKSHLKENDPVGFLPSTHQPQPSSRWQSNKSQMVRDQLNTAADKSDELEEFSLLHSNRARKFRPALKPVPNKKANLSGFFSSPAPIPELSLQGPEGNASLLPEPKVHDRQSQANGKVSSGSGILSERSQNLATGQVERKLGTTPIGRVPSSQHLSVPVSQKPFQPSPLGTAPVLSGQPSRPLQPAQRLLRHSSSIVGSSSPPQSGSIYTPVPQKQNFTPMRREPGAKIPLFERGGGTKTGTVTNVPLKDDNSGSGTTPNSITDKPKQLLFGIKESISKLFSDPPAKSVEYGPNENEEEQAPEEDMDDYDEIVELEEEQSSPEESFEPPPLRSLPHKNSSPIKSALRPPMKSRTPGRVVEFANSVRQSPTPRRNADVEQRRPVFGGRSTPVIITSSPSTHTESSPVPSPAGLERIQENSPERYEEDDQDEEEHKPDDEAEMHMDMDMNMDMDMDEDIEWYEHEPAPAPAPLARPPRPPPPFPRPLSPGRGRQRQLHPQPQPEVAAAPRQPPPPPLIKPTSTLENSPVIRSGVSLFGHGRRRPLPPPIPPSNRNIVTPLQPLQPLYPSLPPLSSF
ncbi:hypothetical protein N0V85_006862, partial [Neurospora sp. IMI 360204]